MGAIELALEVKAGKKKLSDVPEGRRKTIARLVETVEPRTKAAPVHSKATYYARPRGTKLS